MSYVDGFVLAVPDGNREAFVAHARAAAKLSIEFGAIRCVECWGDDVPDGTVTDFRGAVKAQVGETVLFSWIEWPDKATRDRGGERMMNDPRMREIGEMPFDGKRMILGGFRPVVDERA